MPLKELLGLNFGKYPKAKYEMYINHDLCYFFTTTIRSEENCLEELHKILTLHRHYDCKYYRIFKTVAGNRELLIQGTNPSYKQIA
jgi:hypothetical protein